MADAGNLTFTQLAPAAPNWYYQYGMTMDVDNKKVINIARGTTSTSYQLRNGIYRTDPAAKTITTVYYDAGANIFYSSTGPVHVNQDGDYVFAAYSRSTSSSVTSYHYRMYKVPSLGGSISTLYTSTKFFNQSTTCYQGGQADINTGDYVIQLYNSTAGIRYGILNLSLDGSTLTTWSTGGTYGLYQSYYDGLCQDWDTGNWLSVYSGLLYELTPGTMNRTTLYNLGYPGGIQLYYAGKFDNRSAPNKRIVIGGYKQNFNPTYYAPTICAIDVSGPPYTVTAVECDPKQATARQYNYPYAFHFYRGRHIQTLMTAPKQWQLLISCPNYANKAYVAAISISGYKPPITLPDGRKIYLRPDSLTLLSINNALLPFFNAGPGKLDANGEAKGALNFNLLPSLGIPMWIAVLVLDPAAPGGIAYIPDTYVFKLP